MQQCMGSFFKILIIWDKISIPIEIYGDYLQIKFESFKLLPLFMTHSSSIHSSSKALHKRLSHYELQLLE